MKIHRDEDYYDEHCDEILDNLLDWSKKTYTDTQAAEQAGYNEENWNRIGPEAHITHVKYLAADYDRYLQNFNRIEKILR